MKIQVSTANTIQLDWLVAKCEGGTNLIREVIGEHFFWVYTTPKDHDFPESLQYLVNTEYSTDPSLAVTIMEREKITSGYIDCFKEWECRIQGGYRAVGPTLLIAAMRCWGVSQLGHEVEIPEELR